MSQFKKWWHLFHIIQLEARFGYGSQWCNSLEVVVINLLWLKFIQTTDKNKILLQILIQLHKAKSLVKNKYTNSRVTEQSTTRKPSMTNPPQAAMRRQEEPAYCLPQIDKEKEDFSNSKNNNQNPHLLF